MTALKIPVTMRPLRSLPKTWLSEFAPEELKWLAMRVDIAEVVLDLEQSLPV